jgi:hypothetical protein
MFARNWPSRYAWWDWHYIAALIVLLDLFILSSLFGLLDVYCWDVHSFCLSPEIHKKNTLVGALALPETLAVNLLTVFVNF